jgi:hypothetical protein
MATPSPYGQINIGPYWPRQGSIIIKSTTRTTPFRNYRF